MMGPMFIAATGAEWLAGVVNAQGKFRYRFDPDNPDATTGYNLLRHCGTIWSMVEISNQIGPIPPVVAAGRRAVQRLIDRNIWPYAKRDARCVVGADKVKLGGNGLAILALLEMVQATGLKHYITLARGLAEYIALQQLPDGDFLHKRRFSTDKPIAFRSDYYTGEALFGLLRLHDVTGESRWLEVAERSEEQLAQRGYGVAAQSHWMLYALERLHRVNPRPIYLAHARAIVDDIVAKPGYRATDRSTPIACRSEGLLAYIRLCRRLPKSPELDAHIADCIGVVRDNLQLQLKYRQADGTFVRGAGSREVRIDYVQHNISSFLGYWKLPGAPALKMD